MLFGAGNNRNHGVPFLLHNRYLSMIQRLGLGTAGAPVFSPVLVWVHMQLSDHAFNLRGQIPWSLGFKGAILIPPNVATPVLYSIGPHVSLGHSHSASLSWAHEAPTPWASTVDCLWGFQRWEYAGVCKS
jgi:hypothetical protein